VHTSAPSSLADFYFLHGPNRTAQEVILVHNESKGFVMHYRAEVITNRLTLVLLFRRQGVHAVPYFHLAYQLLAHSNFHDWVGLAEQQKRERTRES